MERKKSMLEKILRTLKDFKAEPYIARTTKYQPQTTREMLYDLMNRGI